MAETKPVGGMGADHGLEYPMEPTAQASGVRESGTARQQGDQSQSAVGEEKACHNGGANAADQDFRERIHGRWDAEEKRVMAMERRILVPKDAEAMAGPKMGKGPAQNALGHDGDAIPFAKAGEQVAK